MTATLWSDVLSRIENINNFSSDSFRSEAPAWPGLARIFLNTKAELRARKLCGHSFVLELIYIHDENIFWQLFLSKQLHDKKRLLSNISTHKNIMAIGLRCLI